MLLPLRCFNYFRILEHKMPQLSQRAIKTCNVSSGGSFKAAFPLAFNKDKGERDKIVLVQYMPTLLFLPRLLPQESPMS